MAIIANRVPSPASSPRAVRPRRVVVKLAADSALPFARGAERALAPRPRRDWDGLARAHPGVTLTPYFASFDLPSLRRIESAAAAGMRAAAPRGLASYYAIDVPAGSDPNAIARDVRQWSNVEVAYVEAGPTPPPVSPGDDPRNVNQRYQDAAPVGIDARWAWADGNSGRGVGFVDVERGWTLGHEDLAAAAIALISGVNLDYPGHGTAVLGEVVGRDNKRGGVGIAPLARTRVVSQHRTADAYNTADAILAAAAVMGAGDVLLLEAQTTYPTVTGYVPVEVEPATFDAIVQTTSLGIVVIEAAGNGDPDRVDGGIDLDAFADVNGRRVLDRTSADFRDSGAILVGAASAAVPHKRLGFSNFGSRVDCYAWGESIDTCGDGWTGNLTDSYTTGFGGTSGASPIVTGAALLLQSWRARRSLPRYDPATMRRLLASAELNTASASAATDRVGVMPNLRAIIESERA